MATWFSDHYSSGDEVSALPANPVRPSAGIGHARKRYKKAKITVPSSVAVNDVLRLMTFRSSDRITDIRVHADDVFTATTDLDVGLYKSGADHDGAAIDDNLFADALDLGGGLEDAEAFIEGTSAVGESRGEPLWFVADLGGGTYSADPGENWDLTGTILVDATTGGTISVEVEYTAGD